ncbi:MAG: hypothetical protein V2I27_12525 [Erythrobacter sp.]|nr:hypothetical protein [Erythrobacter sp.]
MEQTVSLGFLAIMVSAPCALGWAIGDFVGSRRSALRLARLLPAQARRGAPANREAGGGAGREHARGTRQAGRELFADMPSLPELAREIAAIRAHEPLWPDQPMANAPRREIDGQALADHHGGSTGELTDKRMGKDAARPACFDAPSPSGTPQDCEAND